MSYIHGTQLVAAAKKAVGRRAYSSMCQAFCVITSGIGAKGDFDGDRDADAVDGWKKAKARGKVVEAKNIKSLKDIPAGTLAYWTGGSRGYGHVAVTIGDGKVVSTDAPKWGTIGIVPIDWIAKNWRNGLTFVGYMVNDGDGHQMVDAPTPPASPAAAKPKVEPAPWFGVDFRNLAGFNDHGAKTFDDRIPKIVADIGTVGRDVVCVVELPNPKVKDFTRRMKTIGYKHAAGDLGRHIYVLVGVATVGAKIFDLKPRLRGDDTQGVAVQVTPSTTPALIVTAQLENEDASGKTQVAQANSLVDQGEEYATRRGIPHHRIVWAVDTNSDNRVRTEVFQRRGYVDVFDVAFSAENAGHESFVPWGGKPSEGDRIDLIAVHKSRPVRRARLRLTPILTDHLDLFADIGTAPKK